MASLDNYRSEPAQIIALQQEWESVWTPAAQALFPNRPVSVNESLAEKLQQELNPMKFALNNVIDAVVKKYAPKIVVWAWAVSSSTAATFVTTFLDPTTIATDYQEMSYFDVSLNRKVFFFLSRTWRGTGARTSLRR
jgi:hypothetical protein